MTARVLAIGGSDSSGHAGIQADIATITALGFHAATSVTAVTAQDARRVDAIHPIPLSVVTAQIALALADPALGAVKTGMMVDAATLRAVVAALAGWGRALVVDPVLASSSGHALLDRAAWPELRALFAQASLITPNAPEAAALCGHPVVDVLGMRRAAAALRAAGSRAVLIKGGHLPGAALTDLLLTDDGETLFTHSRHHGAGLRGTGCRLASAIACFLANGETVAGAAARAIAFLQDMIARANLTPEPLLEAGTTDKDSVR